MTKKQLTEAIKKTLKLNKEDLRILSMMNESQMTKYLTNLQKQNV